MAKKRVGGKHVTPRTTIQIAVPWLNLARKLSKASKQPVLWYIQGLLAAEADRQQIERPKLPWDESDDKT